MSIRQVLIATVVAVGFSFTAYAAPVVQQAPATPDSKLTLAHTHKRPAATATARRHHHRHGFNPACVVPFPWCW
jgi:hypothetical protein